MAYYRFIDRRDEARTASTFPNLEQSLYWQNNAIFEDMRRKLRELTRIHKGWDAYDADPPNEEVAVTGDHVLTHLEKAQLIPARLSPSTEGGIGLSFIRGVKRAELEIYNTGELAAVTYGPEDESFAWDLDNSEAAISASIETIRVHLSQ